MAAQEEEIVSVTMDNRQAKQALSELSQELGKTGTAAQKAAGDLDKMGEAANDAGRATEQKVVRLKEADRTYEGLLRRIPGTTEALQKYSQIQQRAAVDLANGRIAQETYQRVLSEASNKYVQAATATTQAMTAQRSAIQATADTATKSTLNIRNAMGQMSMQIQDVAVQLAGGQNPFLVMAQQGSQMAGAFGAGGAALGALIAIGGGVAMALSGAASETKALDDAAASAKATTDALNLTLGNTASSADDLAEKYKKLGKEMRAVEAVALMSAQRKIMEETDDLRKAVDAQVKSLEGRRKEFELSQKMISQGATPDPKNLERFTIMRETFKAIDDFRKGGSIEALTVRMNDLGKMSGDTEKPLNEVTDSLVESAKRSNELGEKTKFVEAQMKLLNGTASETDKKLLNLQMGFTGTAEHVQTLSDIINEAIDTGKKKTLDEAWSTVSSTIKEGTTEAEKYRKKVSDVQSAMKVLEDHAEELGNGLKALSPSEIEAINRALKEQDPAWQEAKKSAQQYQEDVKRIASDIGRDISENLWDQITGEAKAGNALDFFKKWAKRLAVAMLNEKIIMPISMQLVDAVPGLFGLTRPNSQPAIQAANQNTPGIGFGSFTNGSFGLSSLTGGWLDRQLGGAFTSASSFLQTPLYTIGGTSVPASMMQGIDSVGQLGGVPGVDVTLGQGISSGIGIITGGMQIAKGGTGNVIGGGGQIIGSALTLMGMPEIGIPLQIASQIFGDSLGPSKATIGPIANDELELEIAS